MVGILSLRKMMMKMKSEKFISYDKMSKKARREYLRAHRKPATPPKQIHDSVYKYKLKKQKGE